MGQTRNHNENWKTLWDEWMKTEHTKTYGTHLKQIFIVLNAYIKKEKGF